MSAADWYPDPTEGGRLRYWDGSRWTEHVSTDGQTATAPIEGVAPAPPRPQDAAGTSAPATSAEPVGLAGAVAAGEVPSTPTGPRALFANGTPGGPTMLGRLGFVVGAVGGVLTAFTSGKVAVEQAEPFGASITVGGGSWLGIVAAVICLAGALSPWLWGRLAAATCAWFLGALISFAVIGFRTDEIFSTGPLASDVTLGTAGWLMAIGAVLLLAGTVVALIGVRVPVRDVDPDAVQNPREGKGISSLICGIVGFIIPVTAPAAIGLGLAAGDDIRASGGRVSGGGMAKAGIILGIVALSLWGVGLVIALFTAQP